MFVLILVFLGESSAECCLLDVSDHVVTTSEIAN